MSYAYIGSGVRREHVQVAQKALGKPLPAGAEVHHVDGDTKNNDPRNLVICPSRAYHALLHIRQEALDATGNANSRKCKFCQTWGVPAFSKLLGKDPVWGEQVTANSSSFYHKKCVAAYQRTRRAK